MEDDETSGAEMYRTIDDVTVRPVDVYEGDGTVKKEFVLTIDGQKLSGPLASDYELLVEILSYFEEPVTPAGVEALEGREIPVCGADIGVVSWTQVDGDKIREGIELGRVWP